MVERESTKLLGLSHGLLKRVRSCKARRGGLQRKNACAPRDKRLYAAEHD